MQYNLVYVLTTLIALFVGLTKGLRFAVYYIELIIFKVINHRKQNNQVASYSHPSHVTIINPEKSNKQIQS